MSITDESLYDRDSQSMIGIRHLSNIHKSVFAEITNIKGVSASFVEAWGFIPSFCSFANAVIFNVKSD